LPPTASQTVGPFFSFSLLDGHHGAELVPPGSPGAVRIRGQVVDGVGEPVPDALVEIWQADAEGRFQGSFGFGRSGTEDGGWYEFVTVKPGAVPGPDGRPQAPHIDVSVFARGLLKRLVTRVYFPDEEAANASDPVLSALDAEARATLLARPDGDGLRFDVRLQGDGQTTFFAL
jgi:protocatechuate 3,4-dioxygenase alpha subunit